MKLFITLLGFTGIILILLFLPSRNSDNNTYQQSSQPQVVKKNILSSQTSDQTKKIEYIIKPQDTFGSILSNFNISQNEAQSALEASKNVYDFTEIKADHLLKLQFNSQNELQRIEYDINNSEIVIVKKNNADFEAAKIAIIYDVEQISLGTTIVNSLFADASAIGLEDKIILELVEIFSWDIDFATDIQEGDSFRVVYEKRFRNGQPTGSGKILSARFNHRDKDHWAFYYQQLNEQGQYYSLQGKSLSRQFLKSPLDYSYISSNFSNGRFHPVLKKVLPHRAIDYAAAAGTPITATADGKIVHASWKNGDGIHIEIKHNGVYSTFYSHLSELAKGVIKEAVIKQGQIIGYVGSTGYSTGSHLEYSMKKNNVLVNPLAIDLPQGESIKDEWMKDFADNKEKFKNLLE